MQLKKSYLILSVTTLSIFSTTWILQHNQHRHLISRSIASEEKVENLKPEKSDSKEVANKISKEDQIKNLEDLVTCQKKIISDLKDDMANKIDELKKIVADYDKKNEKKDSNKEPKKEPKDENQFVAQPNDQQVLAVLMHLTSLIQSNQFNSQSQMSMSYMPAYEQMLPQHSFYRDYYENNMFYNNIGMGRNFMQQSYPGMGLNWGTNSYSNTYQNPFQNSYQDHNLQYTGYISNNLQRMPMLGDQYTFGTDQNLVRQPSSGGFQF